VDAASDNQTSSSAALERIHRLERQERERLARQDALLRQRTDKVTAARGPGDARRGRLENAEHLLRIPMAAIGVAWAIIGIITLTNNSNGLATATAATALFVIWLVVVVEFAVRYVVVPDRKRYFASRRVEPVMVVVPFFQVWRLVGVERMTVLVGEGIERLFAILRHRGLFRVLLAAVGLLFLGAWVAMLFESRIAGSNIHTYKDALWWSVVTVTTVGYGDRFPVSDGGKAVAVVLMMVGIGLIGVLTATVASFFVQEHTDANKDQLQAAHADLGSRLSDIDDRLGRLEVVLGAAAGAPHPTTPST
jgi:voltage-gated potassium channel